VAAAIGAGDLMVVVLAVERRSGVAATKVELEMEKLLRPLWTWLCYEPRRSQV